MSAAISSFDQLGAGATQGSKYDAIMWKMFQLLFVGQDDTATNVITFVTVKL